MKWTVVVLAGLLRRLVILVGLLLLATPIVVQAQQQTCEQRAAIMGQLIEDMAKARAVLNVAEVDAASLKVQNKALQEQVKGVQAELDKLKDAAKSKEPETAK